MKNKAIIRSCSLGRILHAIGDRLLLPVLFMIALLAATQAMASPTQAADPPDMPPKGALAESIRVSPTKFEIMLKPGRESTASIRIHNGTREKMKVTMAVWNFARDDRGTALPISAKDEARFRGAASWIKHARKPIILEADEATTTVIKVRAPKKTALGSYSTYVRIIGTRAAKRRESLNVRYIIDALVLPIVMNKSHSDPNTLTTKVEFGGMSSKGSIFTSLPFEIIAKVKNKGNVHQNFDGAIEIWQGKVRLTEIPLKRTLLPEATSVFIGTVKELPYFGKLRAKFSGSVFMAQDFGEQTVKGQVTFWYIPALFIYIAGGIVFLLLFLIGATVFIRRRRATKTKKLPDDFEPESVHISEDEPEPTQAL